MTDESGQAPPGASWMALVRTTGTPEFAKAFAAEATLDATVLGGTLVGADAIGAFFTATSGGMYEHLAFIAETSSGKRSCYEWSGKAFGMAVGGATLVSRNNHGLIDSVQLFHRPYPLVALFSAELSRRLAGKVDPALLGAPG